MQRYRLRATPCDFDVGQNEIVQELARRDYLMDYRPGAGIRLAPHFYTTDEELELAIREISALRGAYSGSR